MCHPGNPNTLAVRRVAVTLIALSLSWPIPGMAANDGQDELGNWLIFNSTIRFADHWSLFTESQLRVWEPISNPNEFFVRVAPQYHINKKMFVALGYMWTTVEPFKDDGPDSTENRIYQQLTAKHNWGRPVIEHRLRTEQRWIEEGGSTDFRNRFRYRLQATVPLKTETVQAGGRFLNFYNEIFLNYGSRDETFDQNRLYGAYGFQFSKQANLQLGLLWQRRSSSRDFFRFQIFYTHNFDTRGN